MPYRPADDPHVSNLVLSPTDTLALIKPHLPCACANCTAVTLMMAAGMAVGQRYSPSKIGGVWRQVALAGEKMAELASGLTVRRDRGLTPREGDRSATREQGTSPCRAFRARGAH